MIVVKLNEKYPNEFITTQDGLIFYRKNNTLNKEESIHEANEEFHEIEQLISQGTLIIVNDKRNNVDVVNKIKENIDTEVKGMVTEDRKEANKIVKESISEKTVEAEEEIKVVPSEEVIEKAELDNKVEEVIESDEPKSNEEIIKELN